MHSEISWTATAYEGRRAETRPSSAAVPRLKISSQTYSALQSYLGTVGSSDQADHFTPHLAGSRDGVQCDGGQLVIVVLRHHQRALKPPEKTGLQGGQINNSNFQAALFQIVWLSWLITAFKYVSYQVMLYKYMPHGQGIFQIEWLWPHYLWCQIRLAHMCRVATPPHTIHWDDNVNSKGQNKTRETGGVAKTSY